MGAPDELELLLELLELLELLLAFPFPPCAIPPEPIPPAPANPPALLLDTLDPPVFSPPAPPVSCPVLFVEPPPHPKAITAKPKPIEPKRNPRCVVCQAMKNLLVHEGSIIVEQTSGRNCTTLHGKYVLDFSDATT